MKIPKTLEEGLCQKRFWAYPGQTGMVV